MALEADEGVLDQVFGGAEIAGEQHRELEQTVSLIPIQARDRLISRRR